MQPALTATGVAARKLSATSAKAGAAIAQTAVATRVRHTYGDVRAALRELDGISEEERAEVRQELTLKLHELQVRTKGFLFFFS
jgi:hypothetical protein